MKKVGFNGPGIMGGGIASQLLVKDYKLAVPMTLLSVTRDVYEQARKNGKGGQDFPAITGWDQEEKSCAF